MEEIQSQDFDEFSIEMGDYEVAQVKKYDRYLRIETGGSIATVPLIIDSVIYFGCFNHNFYALDAKTGEEIWRYRTYDRNGASGPVYSNGLLIFGSYDQNVYALDAKKGELVWNFKTDGPISTSGAVKDGTFYLTSNDQNVYALNSANGSLKWKLTASERNSSMPTLLGEKMFFGSYDRNLYCVDSETGKVLWKFGTQGEVHNLNPFPIRDGIIYVGSFDNTLRAVRIEDRLELWKTRVSNYGLSAQPVLDEDVMYLGTRDGNVLCLSMEGKILWKFVTNEVVHIPVIHGEKLMFGSGDHNFYCIDKKSGKELWRFHTEGPIYISLTIWEGKVYFGSHDCHLYCLDLDGNLVWKFRTEGEPSFIPPPYEAFEVRMKVPESEFKEEETKRYELDMSDEGENVGSFYKSRITYQVSTQYTAKGKYQIDSDEEEF